LTAWEKAGPALGVAVALLTTLGSFCLTAQANSLTAEANKTTSEQAELSRRQQNEQAKINRQQQAADRFARAVDQLGQTGAERDNIRLGGVFALDSLMHDSQEFTPRVTEMLCAFIRTHLVIPTNQSLQKADAEIPPDVKAAIMVLSRRPNPEDRRYRLDLTDINLNGAKLSEVDLQYADLRGSTLMRADLTRANLSGARLGGANLSDACLGKADLQRADLEGANSAGSYASLFDAHLNDTDLRNASLGKINYRGHELRVAKTDGATLPPRKDPEGQLPADDRCG
jgi:hypothetical protein